MKTDLDFKNWIITYREVPFNTPPDALYPGWQPDFVTDNITFEQHAKSFRKKLYPVLIIACANYKKDRLRMPMRYKELEKAPEQIKDLLRKFYNEGMEYVVLHMSIIAKSHNKKASLKYSPASYCFIPNECFKKYPKPYEFLLPDFWFNNKICEPLPTAYDEEEGYECPVIDYDFAGTVLLIWQNYCLTSSYLLMDNIEFMHYLETLLNLAKDTVTEPILDLPESKFNNWLNMVKTWEHPIDRGHNGLVCARWDKGIPSNKKELYALRILDARDYLNDFFKKYNYFSMKNALELFLIKMYESLADELVERRLLSKCNFCENHFLFDKGKKYCSLRSDGKDCGTRARNKRYYSKHRNKILPRAKVYARKYRSE